ncbi:RNA helicase [Malassezia nana]|uniref:RNA helicase n=1 Tax=Malassezia nana TaxID=180528 RepID=A0AAF0EGG7_9BASI|nr:RNA helicase [Malassezia nana]
MDAAQALPVWAGKDKIVQRIRENDTVILVGETGSGKTTQVPQFLLKEGILTLEGSSMIAITQPRRVAATSLARRVAAELGCADPATLSEKQGASTLPEWVGYSVRFDDRTTRHTRIKFLTDGMLMREVLGPASGRRAKSMKGKRDHLLQQYAVLIIDEAHERSLRTDMVLGLAKRIQRERRACIAAGDTSVCPLKIVVMSATIDAERFAQFFSHGPPVPILYVAGRQHGVRLYHTASSCQDWTDAAVRTVLQIHVSKPLGDILVFATGQEEIESMTQSLRLYAGQLDAWAKEQGREDVPALLVRPLYAALGPSASAAVFALTPRHTRKVVLATNIAETSITIPGVRYVIDSGLVKEKVFSPQSHVETLQVLPVSQSSSLQRAGRAGREGPGECYRLYTREAFQELQPQPTSEIHRTELSGAVLQLYAMGVDPFTFDWIEPPATALLHEAVLQLAELGAVDSSDQVQLTALGHKLAAMPVTPSYARLLLAAAERGPAVAGLARDLVSILSADHGLFVESSDPAKREAAEQACELFVDASGDHVTLLNALQAYLAAQEHAFQTHGSAAAARQELKMWCQTHAIHERTMRNVLAIRKQLTRLCQQHGLDVTDDAHTRTLAVDDTLSGSDDEALVVTRPRASVATEGAPRYTELLPCLGVGRLSHVALRQPDGTFRRVAGGPPFKLHPTCVLHASRHGARGTSQDSVQAIVFEELVMTSQTFARTVSKLEPVWLQALLAAS